VNPSPLQPEAPELHIEASALPGTPPSLVVASEQSPAPAQEISHEVLICTYLCYLLLSALLTRQHCSLRIRPHHHQVCQCGIIQLPRQGKECIKLRQRKC
jgi:hypothetical protein